MKFQLRVNYLSILRRSHHPDYLDFIIPLSSLLIECKQKRYLRTNEILTYNKKKLNFNEFTCMLMSSNKTQSLTSHNFNLTYCASTLCACWDCRMQWLKNETSSIYLFTRIIERRVVKNQIRSSDIINFVSKCVYKTFKLKENSVSKAIFEYRSLANAEEFRLLLIQEIPREMWLRSKQHNLISHRVQISACLSTECLFSGFFLVSLRSCLPNDNFLTPSTHLRVGRRLITVIMLDVYFINIVSSPIFLRALN